MKLGREAAVKAVVRIDRRRRHGYVLAVTAMAAFLLGLPFGTQRERHYNATARVLGPSRAVLESIGLGASDSAGIEHLAAALPEEITFGANNRAGQDALELDVTSRGQDSAAVAAAANEAAKALCEAGNRALAAELAEALAIAQDDLVVAEAIRDEIQQRLAAASARRQQLLGAPVDGAAPSLPAASPLSAPTNGPTNAPTNALVRETATTMVLNPQWQAVHAQIQALDAEHAELLKRYTDQHPQIVHNRVRRDELAAKLTQIPQQVAGTSGGGTNGTTTHDAGPGHSGLAHGAASTDVPPLPERTFIEQTIATIEESLRQAEAEVAAARNAVGRIAKYAEAQPPSLAWTISIAAWASDDVSGGMHVPMNRLALLSLLTGVGFAWVSIGRDATYESSREARAALPFPVVGVVAGSEPTLGPSWARRLTRQGVKLCEFTILAIALVLLVKCMLDQRFAGRLIQQPLHVLSNPREWFAGWGA